MKKIGIIGSGIVGQTLAKGFIKHGYTVTIGSRNPEKLEKFITENKEIKSGSFNQAAAFGEIIVVATKGHATLEALKLAGEENLNNKTIIDTTNPIDETKTVENGVLHYYTNLEESQMETLQQAFPNANFVKAFNSIGNAHMVNPTFESKPTMFICGNNEEAKKEVKIILDQFGFETEDMGKANAARAIEPLCILWCINGFLKNDWNHAFKLLKK